MTTMHCPACGAEATGKFCANCAAPLQGAVCAGCHAPLTPGAKFCHRCGTPAGAQPAARATGVGNALPWAVAAIALLALVALVAGQRMGRGRPPGQPDLQTAGGEPAPAGVRAPDISSLSPAERAERLYDRIMGAAERGRMDSARFFLPMALQAYDALGNLSVDQRYDLGRLAEVAGNPQVATAQADTILSGQSTHLLGLVLASRAARLRGDERAERAFMDRLVKAEPTERPKQLPEYLLHQTDIEIALAEWRQRKGGGR